MRRTAGLRSRILELWHNSREKYLGRRVDKQSVEPKKKV